MIYTRAYSCRDFDMAHVSAPLRCLYCLWCFDSTGHTLIAAAEKWDAWESGVCECQQPMWMELPDAMARKFGHAPTWNRQLGVFVGHLLPSEVRYPVRAAIPGSVTGLGCLTVI